MGVRRRACIGFADVSRQNEASTAVTIDRGMPLAVCAGTVAADELEEYVATIAEAGDPGKECAHAVSTGPIITDGALETITPLG